MSDPLRNREIGSPTAQLCVSVTVRSGFEEDGEDEGRERS